MKRLNSLFIAFQNILVVLSLLLCLSCGSQSEEDNSTNMDVNATLFRKVDPAASGISFMNVIQESPQLNYYTYKHMYIGAGVAVGDFNNDGLEDAYMVGNMSPNKLYLNKGEFKFEDITTKAGAEGGPGFYMGVTLVDINEDGWLDIYLCKSGKYRDSRVRENVLLINNQDLTFTNKAAEYGLNNSDYSVQSSFFDYDRDGDLDMYLVNTPVTFSISGEVFVLDYVYNNPDFKKLGGNDRLYRNDGGKFIDVTSESGILPDLGFGLSVSTTDFNQDGWPDIFVANDFIAPDYMYINNGDGTFRDASNEVFRHTSFYSMGSDASDINNDGFTDLMVVDMNPADYVRSKTTMQMMDRKLFSSMVESGYNSIFMHNMVHMNTGMGSFSEVGNLSGMANTDWSWSVLAADFDLDGWKDVHISNGIYRDVLDRDRRNSINEFRKDGNRQMTPDEVFQYLKSFPSERLSNYAFRNNNGLEFEQYQKEWGLDDKGFSNGVALADFDNDGDLDLLINNLMDTAFLYENVHGKEDRNYLKIKLKGTSKNPEAIGAKITISIGNKKQHSIVQRTRGYLSGSSQIAHFGLGDDQSIERIKVEWPDGNTSLLTDIKSNQLLEIDYSQVNSNEDINTEVLQKAFVNKTELIQPEFTHIENDFDDYERQVLLPYSYSRLGPFISVGDVNGDGLDDFYIGGSKGQAGAIYIQDNTGNFIRKAQPLIEKDADKEDMRSSLFDFDNDGDLDLYVASGGYEFNLGDEGLQDRLYINDGTGSFSLTASLPDLKTSNSSVLPHDFDGDGDLDLFVGGRVLPGAYPFEPKSYLLENKDGSFVDVVKQVAPELEYLGMITDGIWVNLDKDESLELVVVGEWMSIHVFDSEGGKMINKTEEYGLQDQKGWWQSINANILSDGQVELFVGNVGRNIKHKASIEKPFHVYASDFDKNNSVDIILAKYYKDKQVPVRGKDCTTEQMPFIAEKFETFDEFASTDVQNMLGEGIDDAKHFETTTFASKLIRINNSKAQVVDGLPADVQISPVSAAVSVDINGDSIDDYIHAGNLFATEVETTHMDAGTGGVLITNERGDKVFRSSAISGFYTPTDVKDIQLIENSASGETMLVVSSNSSSLKLFSLREQ